MALSVADLRLLVAEEQRRRQARLVAAEAVEPNYRGWIEQMFAPSRPLAPHHVEMWRWGWGMQPGVRPRPFVGIWPRGGGKSTRVEMLCVSVGARRKEGRPIRPYAVIVSESQAQADGRVGNVGTLLESSAVARHYPGLGTRALGKFGSPKGWRRNRLRAASGYVVDALGLDVAAARGLKVDDNRPGLIIFDDIDGRHDTARITEKKITTVTETILPMGADDCAVAVVQNMIISDGVVARLADGRAGFLVDRIVSGPIPAIYGMETINETLPNGATRTVVTGGEPSWEGQSLAHCQQLIDNAGFRAFLREQQHDVAEREGALWKRRMIKHVEHAPAEGWARVVIGVDPSGGVSDIGIVVAALSRDGVAYVLQDATQPGIEGTWNWSRTTWQLYDHHKGDAVAAERNYGGDMVAAVLEAAAHGPMNVVVMDATRGKDVRAEPVVQKYATGHVLHLGAHPDLEDEMTQWEKRPGQKSPNRVDALVWALTELFWPKDPIVTDAVWGRKR